MSGLFHRLAAQALGRPSPLRPGVRLPLAPGPGLHEEPLHPPAPGVAPGPRRPGRRSPGQPAVGAAGPDGPPIVGDGPRGERDAAAADRGERAPLARPAPMPPPAPAVERPVPPAGGPRDAPQPVDARRAPAESVVTEEPARRAVAPPAVAGGDRRTGGGRMPALPGNPEQRRRAVPVPARPRVAPGPAGWEPLLPARPAAPIPASPARWPAPGEPAPAAEGRDRPVTEVTEVHVSIGRIEVTAPRGPAPKPGPRPSEERTPMSLDEYLTRRERART